LWIGPGYEPVRSLEAGALKEAKGRENKSVEEVISGDKTKKRRRTAQQIQQQWDNGERHGLYQCERCHRVYANPVSVKHRSSSARIQPEHNT
jgi:hypothetical protein